MKLTIPPFIEETAVDNSQMINLSVCSLKPTWSLSVSCSSLVWPCSRTVLPSPFSPKTLWKQGSVFKHASARFNGILQAQRHEEEKVLQNTIARCWNEHGSLFMCKVLCCVCVCARACHFAHVRNCLSYLMWDPLPPPTHCRLLRLLSLEFTVMLQRPSQFCTRATLSLRAIWRRRKVWL